MKLTLKALRVNKGLTIKEAAKILGISEKTLCNWENNKTFPSAKKIQDLEKIYDCKYDNIIFLRK